MVMNKNPLLALALFNILIAILLYQDVVLSIIHEWESNGPYSHGSLGLLVFFAAIWQRRTLLKKVAIKPSRLGGLFLFMSLIILFFARLASIQQLQQLSMFAVVVTSVMYILGFHYSKILFLPFLILLLSLPVWNLLQQPLRIIATEISYIGANLLGTSIDREGFTFRTPGGNFEVEPACSGLGFFLVAALLAVCLSCFERLKLKQSIHFLFVALSVALVANWLRIISIIVVGDITNMQHLIVTDHLTFGWLVFLVCLVPLIFYSKRFIVSNQAVATGFDKPKPVVLKNELFPPLIAAIIIIFSSVSYQWLTSRYDNGYAFELPKLSTFELISADKAMSPNWRPDFLGANSEKFYYYIHEELGLQVYIANYVRQYQAHEMIHIENKLFDDRIWNEVEHTKLSLSATSNLNKSSLLELKNGSKRYRLISYWYAIAGGYTADKKTAKLAEIKGALQGRPEASIIAVAIDYNTEGNSKAREQAIAALAEFTIEFTNGSEALNLSKNN